MSDDPSCGSGFRPDYNPRSVLATDCRRLTAERRREALVLASASAAVWLVAVVLLSRLPTPARQRPGYPTLDAHERYGA